MILTHPDNLKLLPTSKPSAPHGWPLFAPLDGIEIRTDPLIPRTHKTWRLLWPRDPFITYEESDRQWGLPLGICTEEESPAFLSVPDMKMEPFSLDVKLSDEGAKWLEDMQAKVMRGLSIPRRVLFASFTP